MSEDYTYQESSPHSSDYGMSQFDYLQRRQERSAQRAAHASPIRRAKEESSFQPTIHSALNHRTLNFKFPDKIQLTGGHSYPWLLPSLNREISCMDKRHFNLTPRDTYPIEGNHAKDNQHTPRRNSQQAVAGPSRPGRCISMNLLPYLFSAVEEPIRYSLAAFEPFPVLHPLTPIAEPQSDFDYPGALNPDIMHTALESILERHPAYPVGGDDEVLATDAHRVV
ncbi:hypothetical protein C8J57DRAFT_1238472 [Mycena rebaudengoi]|nr:hypothetical protein C8J57DRAFT_1238472 [Mycena rebaudengoi]